MSSIFQIALRVLGFAVVIVLVDNARTEHVPLPIRSETRLWMAQRAGVLQCVDDCGDRWADFARYAVVMARIRVAQVWNSSGPRCGGPTSVYRALIRNDFWDLAVPTGNHNGPTLVFLDSTGAEIVGYRDTFPGWNPEDLALALPGLRASTIADYFEVNETRTRLASLPSMPNLMIFPRRIITDWADTHPSDRNFWEEEFFVRYPANRGLIALSLPGFSTNGRQALVEVGISRGELNGEGHVLLLECRNGRWVHAASWHTWSS